MDTSFKFGSKVSESNNIYFDFLLPCLELSLIMSFTSEFLETSPPLAFGWVGGACRYPELNLHFAHL